MLRSRVFSRGSQRGASLDFRPSQSPPAAEPREHAVGRGASPGGAARFPKHAAPSASKHSRQGRIKGSPFPKPGSPMGKRVLP